MINRDYFINVLKLKEWETLDEAELYIDRAKKRVLALINVDFDFENDYDKYKETLDDCIVEYSLFFSKNDYDLNSNSQSISFAGNSFSESRTIDEANVLNYVVKLLKKAGLIIDQAFDYVETFYDNTKQKINNVDLDKETKEKLTNLNIKVDNYLEKYYELKRQYEANFASLQSEVQKLKDKKDEFNIEKLKTIFLQLTSFEEFKNEFNLLKKEFEDFKYDYAQDVKRLELKDKDFEDNFIELENKINNINTNNFVSIIEFESFKNELNHKLKTFDNIALKNDIARITSQITTIFDRLSKVETLHNEQKTKLEALGTKTINNENKISDIYNKLKNDTSINLYESLKTLFNCLDASIQSENIKTIKDFQDLYDGDDGIINAIFKDKDNNIAMYLKSEDNKNYFFDFSNATAETHFLKDHPFIDDDKLEKELEKTKLIKYLFKDKDFEKWTFFNEEEFKKRLKQLTFKENNTYYFYKTANNDTNELMYVGKYVIIDSNPHLQMFNVGNDKNYPFVFYVDNEKNIWNTYDYLQGVISENSSNISKKQGKVDGLNFSSDNIYSLIHYTKPQTNIRIGSNTNSGYKSNLFIDRDRDGQNIFRYIETNSKVFTILTPTMQGDTDIEIANDNGVKYISLKIDGEELKLTKEKLIKLRNLLN